MYNFEAFNDIDRKNMLSSIGINSVDELFEVIPNSAKMDSLDLDNGHDELEAQFALKKLASLNKTGYACFIGAGARNRYIPNLINDIASRFEFLSCYTPYQAEISQGSLESMYEFQSMMCTLTNQDVSNASVYDGASATAEAILMAVRLTKKNKVFVYDDINENYLEVIKTYLWANNIELVVGKNIPNDELPDEEEKLENPYLEDYIKKLELQETMANITTPKENVYNTRFCETKNVVAGRKITIKSNFGELVRENDGKVLFSDAFRVLAWMVGEVPQGGYCTAKNYKTNTISILG